MAPLIILLASVVLLIGFLVLTRYEARRGMRYFAGEREFLDTQVMRIQFIIEHVDLAAFLRDEIRHLANRLGHSIVHISLLGVRAVERLLTRLVKLLRTRYADNVAPRESAREFVKTLSEFKDGLKETHPDVSDIR